MAQAADIGSKRLISLAPDLWVQWVTQIPDVEAREIVTSEFQWITRESDVLVRTHSPQDGEFLVLNELQLRYNPQMPRRMRAYAALIPFVPVLRGGGEESVVRRALQVLRTDEQLGELEPLLAFFASFVLESPLVQQIMRWDMAVLRESPWYQEILQEGQQRGRQQGLQQGMRQGLLSGITLGLELKFGSAGLQLLPEIREIENVERLEAIAEAIKTVSTLDELRQIYATEE